MCSSCVAAKRRKKEMGRVEACGEKERDVKRRKRKGDICEKGVQRSMKRSLEQ